MTSKRSLFALVAVSMLLMVTVVWGAQESGLSKVEESIPWRYIAILLIGLAGWMLSRMIDRINKLLDEYGHDITRIKEHLGLKD